MPGNDFNEAKAVFWLVAGVVCVYSFAALVVTFQCVLGMSLAECARIADGKLSEAFATLLAGVFAFAAGRASK